MEQFKWLPVVYITRPNMTISIIKPGADDLIATFGTIGVHIHALHRGKGLSKQAIMEGIEVARELGHTEVFFVTEHDNIPSQRMILSTGAELVSNGSQLRYKLKVDQVIG